MYVLPILLFALVIAIGTAWSPIFALLIAVPLFVLFLAYVGLSRRADQTEPTPDGAPRSDEGGTSGGIWGERT